MTTDNKDWIAQVEDILSSRLLQSGGDESQEAISCRLHALTSDADHNCLGCNFARQIAALIATCRNLKSTPENQEDWISVATLLYWMNPIVDACVTTTHLAGLDLEKFRSDFPGLIDIKPWANFFKHPKAFQFTHHATLGFTKPAGTEPSVMINTEFVQKFYKNTKKNRELRDQLKGSDAPFVELPNMTFLAKRFCEDFEGFLTLVESDPIWNELKSDAVFDAYFEALDEASDHV